MKKLIKNNFPFLAFIGRGFSNLINYFLYKKNNKYSVKKEVIFVKLKKYVNTFWGYYDKSTFNPKNNNLFLIHANNANPFKKPDPNVKTDILLCDIKTREVLKKIDTVYAWNWQQGSRLHWLDSDRFIYNIFNKNLNKYQSIIYNIKTDIKKLLDIPVQESYKSKYILSLSYEALYKVRPDYGYRNKNTKKFDFYRCNITYLSLSNNKIKKLISVEDIIMQYIDKKKQSIVNKPIINHILVNPDGNKFVFLFRYYLNNHRKHILFLYNLKDTKLRILIRNQVISHYTWRNNSSLIFWGKIDDESGYFNINIYSRKIYKINIKLPDGHPVMLDENTFVTDTYPDKSRLRHLMKIDLIKNNVKKFASFCEHPFLFGETRCDLHPNVDNSINYLNVDTIFKNKRMIALIKI